MKLSIALATRNEERNIGTCLEAVKGFGDEVVVADEGSTDQTVVIAKKYGARIIIAKHEPIFHITKQKALDACTGDWILQLDADERVTPALAREIKLAIRNTQSAINGYWLPRKNYFLGRYLTKGGQYPDYTLRLYRKGIGRLPCESVHEQAMVNGSVGYLKNSLLHNPFPNFAEYLSKANRYTDLLASEYRDQGLKTDILGFLNYICLKPCMTFINLYLRHQGFKDEFPGFIFAFFSGIQIMIAYIKYWEFRYAKKIN